MCRLNQNILLLRMPPLLPNWTADWTGTLPGLLDEGIPPAYVPPVDIVIALMQAASAADRLAFVGAERDGMADACLKILEEGSLTTAFPEFSPLAQAAVKASIEGAFSSGPGTRRHCHRVVRSRVGR